MDEILSAAAEGSGINTLSENVRVRYALRLIDSGYYWEAHEVLEPVWLHAAENSRERHLAQAIIHCTNAMLKTCMGRDQAANRLWEMAERTCHRAMPDNVEVIAFGLSEQDIVSLFSKYQRLK